MGEYERYLKRLKGARAEFNDRRLFALIEGRIKKERARKLELILSSSLIIFVLVFVSYFNLRPFPAGSGENLSQYIFQQGEQNGSQVMNYVFME